MLAGVAVQHLFPDASGDFSQPRDVRVTLGEYVRHLVRFHDPRFRRDARFLYFAMNQVFRWRAMDAGRLYVRQHPGETKMSAGELANKLKHPGFLKSVLAYSEALHGSQSYWWRQCARVEAMCQQLGMPTFFVTLSAADTFWPDLRVLLGCSDDGRDVHDCLREDPAVADAYFVLRVEVFLKRFFYEFFGVTDSYFRVEYQHRGSPHVHGLVWLPGAPDLSSGDLTVVDTAAVCRFADAFLCTWNPRRDAVSFPTAVVRVDVNPCALPFSDVVCGGPSDVLQKYSGLVNFCFLHNDCRVNRCVFPRKDKEGNAILTDCRYGYPKKLRPSTVLLPRRSDSSLSAGEGFILETQRNDPLISSHNPEMSLAWLANCDLQLIVSVLAVVAYLLKYLNKPEPASTGLLRVSERLAVAAESGRSSAQSVVQSVLMSTVGNRDFSLQETAHHLLSLPLYFCSRTFYTLNTAGLREVGPSGTKTCFLDVYAHRPQDNDEMCLFSFFQFRTQQRVSQPFVVEVKPRYRPSSPHPTVRESYLQQQLALFVPWRGTSESLREGHSSWRAAFLFFREQVVAARRACGWVLHLDGAAESELLLQEESAEVCAAVAAVVALPDQEEVLLAEEQEEESVAAVVDPGAVVVVERALETEPYAVATVGPTLERSVQAEHHQDGWMQAQGQPLAEFSADKGKIDFFQVYRDLESVDVDWLALPCEWETLGVDFSKWVESEKQRCEQEPVVRPAVFRESLNEEQGRVFDSVMEHLNLASSEQTGKTPLRCLVLGKAGTGKSHLIHALRHALGDKCRLLAPTGVAACNVGGQTLHSALSLPTDKCFKPLSDDTLFEFQKAWSGVAYLLVDEVSMVGQKLLGKVDSRLRQAFPTSADVFFGARSVLFFGDFGQLPPVLDSALFSPAASSLLAKQGKLAYLSITNIFLLNSVVRQDGDLQFRDLLLRLHDGVVLRSDWELLCTRRLLPRDVEAGGAFEKALRLLPTRDAVFGQNVAHLRELRSSGASVVLSVATHPFGGRAAEKALPEDACGLEPVLALCVGARVMLLQNLWVERGLVNGTIGTVRGFSFAAFPTTRSESLSVAVPPPPPSRPSPTVVFVEFDSVYSGPRLQPSSVVPIVQRCFVWTAGGRSLARQQFPLTLCWATTVHKSQGLTLDRAVVKLGNKEISTGMTYVALSRVRRLEDLCLYGVDFPRLTALSKSATLRERLAEEERLSRLGSSSS